MITSRPVILIEDLDQDNQQIGFATLETWHIYLYLRLLYVGPKYRRTGVATRLVERAKQLTAGYAGLALQPEAWADEPVRLTQLREWYRRQGFVASSDHDGVFIWTPNQ